MVRIPWSPTNPLNLEWQRSTPCFRMRQRHRWTSWGKAHERLRKAPVLRSRTSHRPCTRQSPHPSRRTRFSDSLRLQRRPRLAVFPTWRQPWTRSLPLRMLTALTRSARPRHLTRCSQRSNLVKRPSMSWPDLCTTSSRLRSAPAFHSMISPAHSQQ